VRRSGDDVTDTVNILLVDDHEENLVALQAILEPLGENLVLAHSGEEALRCLLVDDVAVILLDAQMPGLSGFETAALIKQRAKTRTIPIIFLTAISKEERHVFRGYSTGAVDYLFKPFDPDVLRSKVAVFVDLHRKNLELKRQGEVLRERELTAARRESEQRYRALADAMPQIVWTAGPNGKATYYNRRWYEYTGLETGPPSGDEWINVVHPDDLQRTLARRRDTLASGEVFEVEYRFRSTDGDYRWHLGRAIPLRNEQTGAIDFWVGTATDIDARKRTEQAQDFLLRAGAVLAESLDYRRTLQAVARLAVPEIADWCAIDLLEEDGSIQPLALKHADPAKVTFAAELMERYPPNSEADTGVPRVIRSGEPELVPEITDEMLAAAAVDDLHLDLIRELGLRSYICVPLVVREDVVGAITLAAAESGRRFAAADLRVAEELARRAATTVDNARLFRQAEERAQAAGVLAAIGDGVVLVDASHVVRLWNTAATVITGIARDQVIGKRLPAVWPSFAEALPRVPVGSSGEPVPADTIPVEGSGREVWLSVSGVEFEAGTVYAFRDLTEERALEQMRQDLVATVSHELRTPLAAIYGSALTLRRPDLELDEAIREKLLDVISEESSRLADIVNDLLLASQLDAGTLRVKIERCDVRELVESAVESARTHLPEGIRLEFEEPGIEIPQVAADSGQLRQVLANLIDNAVKYSPEGGDVRIKLEPVNRSVRFSIADCGLGVPTSERARIFEKFYRLDPAMTRGIGGTGLGLYICRELLRRIDGRIWVEPNDGQGSVFHVEVPVAAERKRQPISSAA
jgi:PAS domain S-box-containing protein